MKNESERLKHEKTAEKRGLGKTGWLLIAASLVGLVVLAVMFAPGNRTKEGRGSGQAEGVEQAATVSDSTLLAASEKAVVVPGPAAVIARPTPQPQPVLAVARLAEPSATARALVSGVVNLQPVNGKLTDEQVAAWKENLQQLINHGADSVAAIREFLAKNNELAFGPGGLQVLGYATARTALIDALAQIGGPEAQAAMTATLQTTADPREIAMLAQGLDKVDPGQHRQEALEAVRDALAMAAQGKLSGRDIAPLFEVLQRYGDATLVPELEQYAKRWGYYSMAALAQLPDGAGIASLLQIATGPKWSSGAQDAAWQMIAQVASEFPDARTALLEQVRQNKLSAFNWASMATLLGGDQIHFRGSAYDPFPSGRESSSTSSGSQSLYAAPTAATLTTERMNQQMELIEELAAATTDPVASRALLQARALALRRLGQIATVAPTQ